MNKSKFLKLTFILLLELGGLYCKAESEFEFFELLTVDTKFPISNVEYLNRLNQN